jgi:hypothetical protein
VIITPQLVVDQVATSLSDPKSPLGPVKQMRLTDLMILDHITNGDSQLSDNEYSDIDTDADDDEGSRAYESINVSKIDQATLFSMGETNLNQKRANNS